MPHELPVTLADLTASGIHLDHVAAATIVREVALRVSRGELPGVPSAHVIRLFPSGAVSVEGPVAADDRTVIRAACLLEDLLPAFTAPAMERVPGALRLVLARALRTLDLPPYDSLESFAQALTRFASYEVEVVVRDLVAQHTARLVPSPVETVPGTVLSPYTGLALSTNRRREALVPVPLDRRRRSSPLTVSDIRRARRATGLTLAEISRRSQISARLLCELEWGYLRNWPDSERGRQHIVQYAQAAGLDEQLVVHTVLPLFDEWQPERRLGAPETAEIPIPIEVEPAPAVLAPFQPLEAPRRSRRRWAAALAIPALLALGIPPALWDRAASSPPTPQTVGSAPTGSRSTAPRTLDTPTPMVAAARTLDTPTPTVAAPAPARQPVNQPPVGVSPVASALSQQSAASTPEAVRRSVAPPVEAHPAAGIPDGVTYSPSFDSAGSAMFYQTETNGGSALMRADTDSQGAILRITSVVDDRARNFHARPSPDGRRIAFDSDRDGERGVYVADADGKNVLRISGQGFAAIPSWSPDGGTIAFVRAEADRPRVWNLWTADLSTGQTRRLTSYRVGQPWGASWFPDGRRIAYSHEERLVVLDLVTGGTRVYPSPVKGRLVRTPAVSPDGSRVMFQVFHDGTWLLEMADGSMRKVLSDPSAEEYTWAPDGRRVAYHSRAAGGWGVWLMAAR
ncbi:MAG: helix-turn-helix domain-containing protein [Acidobacteriota bacterium]